MSIATTNVPPKRISAAEPSALSRRPDRVFGPLPASATPAPLRRLPLPVLEPRDAVPVIERPLIERRPVVTPEQQSLDLGPLPRGGTAAVHTDLYAGAATEARSAQQWASRFVQAAVEVASGVRPSGQLVRWTHPDVQLLLERRAALATRLSRRTVASGGLSRERVVIRRVLSCPVRSCVHEVSAVVQDRDRTRAVALRIELFEGRWQATALELG